MRTHSWFLVAAVAIAAPSALAQNPQAPRDGTQEGFFRPEAARAPAAIAEPVAPGPTPTSSQGSPDAPLLEALVVQARQREALERELERSERENARAQAEAARPAVPIIVSPLDGTAPIVSPLGR